MEEACKEGDINRVCELIGSYDPSKNLTINVPEAIALAHKHYDIVKVFIDHNKIDKIALNITIQLAKLLGQEDICNHLSTLEKEETPITSDDLNYCLKTYNFQQYQPAYVH